MKTINKKSAEVFIRLIKLMDGKQHLKIDNTDNTFMPLSIEKLNSIEICNREVDIYSLTHYYKQNGDLVPDPDMTFAVYKLKPSYIWAMSYQDYRTYEESIYYSDGWKTNRKMQKDHTVFAGKWLQNIKHQQNI